VTPTLIGLITLAIGLWLLVRGTPLQLLCAMLAMGLFESSAAIILPALSGSSIPPPRLMLAFLVIAALRAVLNRASLLREGVASNAAILIFAAYGVISAFTLPHIFAGQISVVPLRPAGLRHLTDSFPLFFSAQNITTAFYIAGTGITALCAYIATRMASDTSPIVKACVGITLAQAITGLMGVALAGTAWDLVVGAVRNGSYSQLSQETRSFVRIAGFMAEPSSYARFGVVWMIFALELWLRRVSPRWTGFAALLMAGVLVISTSSTAYIGIAAYGAILAMRFATMPSYLKADRVLPMLIWGVLGLAIILALILLSRPVADAFSSMFEQMTVDKASSESGRQRLFWAMQGVDAFIRSSGLGIGAGSFRSSSLIMAIIGSMGVVGTLSFVASCASLFMPRARDADPGRRAISEAAAWAAVAGLVPVMVMQGSPDPGMEFAALLGLSLALRRPALAPRMARVRPRWGGSAAVPVAG